MHNKFIARTAATAAALGISATLAFTPAAAAPAPTPAEAAMRALTERTADQPESRAGVDALGSYADFVAANHINTIGLYTPFIYAAPTFGCGSNGPITTIIAAGTANGPSANIIGRPGTLTFHATPGHPGIPQASGLVVAWININNGLSGITMLDDPTEFGTPSLSKTIDSGPGTVLASMWGTIDYPGALCVMTPTVGMFPVPEAPAPAPQSAPAAPPAEPGAPAPAPAPAPGPAPAPAPA
ncbi:hypothetical protein [Nocardia jinanensis]|uniref:Uncharacterized protein n=1 Tax=Nocardia jinanensis TaxID=382504 RepID=A0A917VRV1_9NOCA|nr:hypothetical protein [Nocardia jinanensis]GGL08158.1 hypothetical protein GCM10011588_23150 [Nocardia jinanensis]